MPVPHGEYLGITYPNGDFYFVVYPTRGVANRISLLDSKKFRSLDIVRLVVGETKGTPWIAHREIPEALFRKVGKYRIAVGDDMETDYATSSLPTYSCQVRVISARPDTSGPMTEEMSAALARLASDFVIWTRYDFSDEVVKKVPDTALYGLSSIRGDFNGDGRPDVAVMGRGRYKEYIAAVLSTPDGYRAQWLLPPSSLAGRNRSTFIRLQPAGRIQIPDVYGGSPTVLTLKYAAIEVVYGREAGELYYWDKGRLKKITSAD